MDKCRISAVLRAATDIALSQGWGVVRVLQETRRQLLRELYRQLVEVRSEFTRASPWREDWDWDEPSWVGLDVRKREIARELVSITAAVFVVINESRALDGEHRLEPGDAKATMSLLEVRIPEVLGDDDDFEDLPELQGGNAWLTHDPAFVELFTLAEVTRLDRLDPEEDIPF